MMKRLFAAAVVLVLIGAARAEARGFDPNWPPYGRLFQNSPWGRVAAHRQHYLAWHGDYYDVTYGVPIALVVPPTAGMSTDYHWGVAGMRVTPNYHQFARPYPGPMAAGQPFLPTPRWPSDTNQFGVYYVRGPW